MRIVVLFAAFLFLYSVGAAPQAEVTEQPLPFTQSLVVDKLAYPKAILSLQDGRWVIALRDGELVCVDTDSTIKTHKLTLPDLYAQGQGGLLDIELSSDFLSHGQVLMTYSKGTKSNNGIAVVKGNLHKDCSISALETVFAVSDDKDTPVHYGGKLLPLADNEWLVTIGDGFDYREKAQVLTSQLGKVLRFNEAGQPSATPPFPQAPYVYSYGHRNPQGIISLPSGKILLHEHGPDGGDEVNVLRAGANYGWPVVTLGTDYSGASISPFKHYKGMVNPIVDWTPSIAPSSMAYYHSDSFGALTGKVLVTALKAKALYSLDLSASPVVQRRVFPHLNEHLRDVAVGQNGSIYILTDGNDASLIRFSSPM